MTEFAEVLQTSFPGALPESQFVDSTVRVMAELGFTPDNTLACVGVCRDELCQPLVGLVQEAWGEAFMLAGLGGMLFCGRTGLLAAHSHAPEYGGRQRYGYICMAHIGIGASGEPGHCVRDTRPGEVSHACGAILALQSKLQLGEADTELDEGDLEQSILARRIARQVSGDEVSDLVALTKRARACIAEDLQRAVAATVNEEVADYFVVTGVQIHGPTGETLVWPADFHAVVGGTRRELSTGART